MKSKRLGISFLFICLIFALGSCKKQKKAKELEGTYACDITSKTWESNGFTSTLETSSAIKLKRDKTDLTFINWTFSVEELNEDDYFEYSPSNTETYIIHFYGDSIYHYRVLGDSTDGESYEYFGKKI